MKGIFVVIDGLGDLPHKAFDFKTPLEAAETPNLDWFASQGEIGLIDPVHKGFIPSTTEGVTCLLNRNWQDYPRGFVEALGVEIDIKRGDLGLRCNFATIENMKKKKILDRRAGRNLTTRESNILGKAIQDKVKLPVKFIFKPTLQHRAVLVLKGGFSENITNTDPASYANKKTNNLRLKEAIAGDEEENAEYSSNLINSFVEQSYEVLKEHEINKQRGRKGFFPANIVLTREAGINVSKTKKFKRWALISDVPVIKGIGKALGMEVKDYKPIKIKKYDAYEDLNKNLLISIYKNIKFIKKQRKKSDYIFVYFKETDSAGHDNKPFEKKKMIELIDKKFFSWLRNFVVKNNLKLLVTADHSTPCKLKMHTDDAVPVLFFNNLKRREKDQKFNEKDCKSGNLGRFKGKELLFKIGFDK